MKKTRPNEKGQILLLVSVGIVVLGIFIGLAIDLGQGYLMNAKLQRAVDAAGLAAAKALKGQAALEGAAEEAARNAAAMNGYSCCTGTDDLVIAFVDVPVAGGVDMRFVEITGTASIGTTFSQLLSLITAGQFSQLQVSAFAQAGPERPVDLMLVLDRSGSMSGTDGTGNRKIDSLKSAMNEFLNNSFSSDDRVGMTSFGYRGCGEGGNDFTGADCTVNADISLTNSITTVNSLVQALNDSGYTNTMEGLLTAKAEINSAILDPARARSRKAVLLVTDGQPTILTRFDDTSCKKWPNGTTNLPWPGNTNRNGGPFNDGCLHQFRLNGNGMRRHTLDRSDRTGYFGNASLFRALAADTRTKAMTYADEIKDLGSNTVVVFAIGIGKESGVGPKYRLDSNAKCFLARITNDPLSINNCDNVYTTGDGDPYDDLEQGIPAGSCGSNPDSCLNPNHQQGKVFVIDEDADVEQLLKDAFTEIAALLKLRLTI